jgi:formylglycine-generating enzyme required for sulfatase activity
MLGRGCVCIGINLPWPPLGFTMFVPFVLKIRIPISFSLPMCHRSLILLGFLLCWCVLPVAAQAQGKRVALLIGNAAYPGAPKGERTLHNPVRDARLLAKVLKEELRFDEVTVLEDKKVLELDEGINNFIDKASEKPLDTIIVYFSGHGIYGRDKNNYLLGIDANTGVPNAKALKWQGVRADEVRDRIKGLKARVGLLILDACRSGPGNTKEGDKGLRNMGHFEGLLVAYAASPGEVAEDGAGTTGPYAAALARAWRNSGLPVMRQFDIVADEVGRQVPGQRPAFEGNLRSDAYLLPDMAEFRQRQHEADWRLCQTALTVAPCEQYRRKHPQGLYFEQAGTRLGDIRGAETNGASATAGKTAADNTPPLPKPLQAGQVVKDCDTCPEMVMIPGGEFVMGYDKNLAKDEKSAHRVTVPGFMLGKFEITQGQWRALMGRNPSGFKACGDTCPVENVSWDDAQAFIKKLSEKTGRRYRLPTEAEWEYAARAGSQTSWHFGDDAAQLGRYAWYRYDQGNAEKKTHPVGEKLPNQFGLHDIHGNVWEWVEDCWHDNYQDAPKNGSAWVANCGGEMLRVLRGGSWGNYSGLLRSAYRINGAPTNRNYIIGLRVAWTPR